MAFRMSPSPAASALTKALANAPRLHTLSTMLPTVWNTTLLDVRLSLLLLFLSLSSPAFFPSPSDGTLGPTPLLRSCLFHPLPFFFPSLLNVFHETDFGPPDRLRRTRRSSASSSTRLPNSSARTSSSPRPSATPASSSSSTPAAHRPLFTIQPTQASSTASVHAPPAPLS